MNVTPLDLRQQRFNSALRGFDKAEVTAFLAEAADDYEAALLEAERMRQELGRMEAVIGEHREQERNLRNTLTTAQRLADEIKENADQQARTILREADGRADLLLQKAQSRLEDVQREIDALKLKRREVETSIETTIATLRSTLSFVREQEQKERDDKVLLHRPRHQDQVPARDERSQVERRDRQA